MQIAYPAVHTSKVASKEPGSLTTDSTADFGGRTHAPLAQRERSMQGAEALCVLHPTYHTQVLKVKQWL